MEKISKETRELMNRIFVSEADVEELMLRYEEANDTPFEGDSDDQKALYTVFVELQGMIYEGIPEHLRTDDVEKAVSTIQEWLQELANLLGRC